MQNKRDVTMFRKIKNQPVIFITNSLKENHGSSLYFVLQQGTIRCRGHHDEHRLATTFIRPYLISYFSLQKPNVLFQQASPGFSVFEGQCVDYLALHKSKKLGIGHKGHIITETITFRELMDPYFTPTSWRGCRDYGTDWSIARKEVLETYAEVKKNNFSFSKTEHLVNPSPHKKVRF